jgi:hypothetical protein
VIAHERAPRADRNEVNATFSGVIALGATAAVLAVVWLFRRERRTAIDLEAALGAVAPRSVTEPVLDLDAEIARDRDGGGAVATWSASAERALVSASARTPLRPDPHPTASACSSPSPTVPAASSAPRTLPSVARPRFVPITVAAEYDGFDPRLPLAGEPEQFLARAGELGGVRLGDVLAERIGEVTRELVPDDREPESPPDAYEVLRRQRDHIARQVELAYREVHAARTDALLRATQAETQAEQAVAARERTSRMGRDRRRRDQDRGRVPAPPNREGVRQAHDLRVEALKRAAEAEHGAGRVALLRDKAARLLAEQRRLEREMARQLELLLD